MSDLRDFLCWFDGFSENIEKTPTARQWAKIKERVTALRNAPSAPDYGPTTSGLVDAYNARPIKPAAPKPKPKPAFYVDTNNYARKSSGDRITASEVEGALVDLRGIGGEMKTIVWADDSTGLNGRDLTIVAG